MAPEKTPDTPRNDSAGSGKRDGESEASNDSIRTEDGDGKRVDRENVDGGKPSSDNRESSSDNREPSSDNRKLSSDNREPSSDNRESSSDNREPSSDNTDPPSDDREPSSDNTDPPSDDRKLSSDNKDPPSDDRKLSSDNKDPPSDDRKPSSDNRKPPRNNREPPIDNEKPPSDNKKPPSQNKQQPSDYKKPPSDNREPPRNNREPPIDNKKPPSDNKKPPSQNKQQPSDYKKPPSDNREPLSDNQKPPRDNKEPPTDNRKPPSDNREPVVGLVETISPVKDLETALAEQREEERRAFDDLIVENVRLERRAKREVANRQQVQAQYEVRTIELEAERSKNGRLEGKLTEIRREMTMLIKAAKRAGVFGAGSRKDKDGDDPGSGTGDLDRGEAAKNAGGQHIRKEKIRDLEERLLRLTDEDERKSRKLISLERELLDKTRYIEALEEHVDADVRERLPGPGQSATPEIVFTAVDKTNNIVYAGRPEAYSYKNNIVQDSAVCVIS
ncbi:hypothetical protein LSH36_322g04014 [Paralvinella palmiformis]|uniref:Uncharacterized protein n=1 Tax=Paralvinella palmiformis TaxID=53620 RepID=A0AAD9JHC0_9ANNE|nr:hypothetical protein LSH36_322g04014 [Paralvinella palmiformis]